MHVDVIQLRNRGVKLPKADLEGPTRGHLRMNRWQLHNSQEHRMVTTATLTAFGEISNPPIIPPLSDATVTRLDARGMVIVGEQSVGGQTYRQAWFVMLAGQARQHADVSTPTD